MASGNPEQMLRRRLMRLETAISHIAVAQSTDEYDDALAEVIAWAQIIVLIAGKELGA